MNFEDKEPGSSKSRVSSSKKQQDYVPTEEVLSGAKSSTISNPTVTKNENVGFISDKHSLPHSPTRAPMGWSLSLSLSRAKRALEEEGEAQQKNMKKSCSSEGLKSTSYEQLLLRDLQKLPSVKLPQQVKKATAITHSPVASDLSLEEGEVPPSPPHCRTKQPVPIKTKPALSFINDDEVEELNLKIVALEHQVSSLRKSNETLMRSLSSLSKSKEDKHNKEVTSYKEEGKRVVNLEKINKSLEQKLVNSEKMNKSLEQKLKIANDKISDMVSQEKRLHNEIANYKIKITNQRANLTGLENQLMKLKSADKHSSISALLLPPVETKALKKEEISPRKCSETDHCYWRESAQKLEIEVFNLKSRIKNQTSHLANLNAALDKSRQKAKAREEGLLSEIKVARSFQNLKATRNLVSSDNLQLEVTNELGETKDAKEVWKPRLVSQSTRTCLRNTDSVGAHLFEKKVFKVISDNFRMSRSIMQNFEETAYTLPALRPAFRAAIAAMPPATRTLCMGEVMALLPCPSDLLSSSSAEWYDDPDMKDCVPARMAIFWGYQTARDLVEVSSNSAASAERGLPASVWCSPVTPTTQAEAAEVPSLVRPSQLAKTEAPLQLSVDENANVDARGVPDVAGDVLPPGTAVEANPVKKEPVEQVPGSAPGSAAWCPEREQHTLAPSEEEAPAPLGTSCTAAAASPLKEQEQEVLAEVGELGGGHHVQVQAEAAPFSAACCADGEDRVHSSEQVKADTDADSAGKGGASGHHPFRPPHGAKGLLLVTVTAFLHSMYESTLQIPDVGRHLGPALPVQSHGGHGVFNSIMGPELPQYGCQLPPHLLQRQEAQQLSSEEEIRVQRPNRISCSIKELKKRINVHLKPRNPDSSS
ncbi:Girdin [Frankliniella fusca]|uniref:Girdin n=1 Tax=Frankliniella fusca TaxID=407009 RepID=A0AAE1HVU8_9NEOP|nr:Girdin [Frankliniella fusca]